MGANRWLGTEDGSTGRLGLLCVAYYLSYVVTGLSLKYFQGAAEAGLPHVPPVAYLLYSSIGGTILCLGVAVGGGWHRFRGSWRLVLPILPSGVCTAIIVPATTVLFSLPISVMVAMVVMRGSVIVVSRIVDFVQIRQGLLHRQVGWEENVAVGFALSAVGVHVLWDPSGGFGGSVVGYAVLGVYIAAYAVRIYLMNWFKNRGLVVLDNRTWFAWEQIVASGLMALAVAFALLNGSTDSLSVGLREAVFAAHPSALPSMLSGLAYGSVAFFSVFIFLFKGRTATFAGLVNRLTSLLAGTTATVLFALVFGGSLPKLVDWLSLGLIFVAVAFLTRAERRSAKGR